MGIIIFHPRLIRDSLFNDLGLILDGVSQVAVVHGACCEATRWCEVSLSRSDDTYAAGCIHRSQTEKKENEIRVHR